ncbi:hypothetical protein FSP39_024264 [Pinctada imbricata]|uniref:C1q domain-containing protein n=1 Tax=Pinctada imbricata TaxID=66713 RepID=A0AA88YGL5_PINIB|nr:hypothetical protein FSP39_024264 [Pinctada imbricata]
MVAFSAYPGSDLTKIRGETKVVFGSTRTNIGNAYDPKTGVFTAPVDGVYAFHWSLMISKGKYISTYISVNDKNQVLLYGDARPYPTWYFPSQSYVTDLRKGDRVYLITSDGTSDGYIHLSSTFTGYRL